MLRVLAIVLRLRQHDRVGLGAVSRPPCLVCNGTSISSRVNALDGDKPIAVLVDAVADGLLDPIIPMT